MTRLPHAHPLRASDRRHPVDSWSRDLALVLWAIAFVLVIAAAAALLTPGPVQ